MADHVVVDASAMVDLLLGNPVGRTVGNRLAHQNLHAPAHWDAEVLSALGRMHRAGAILDEEVDAMLAQLSKSPAKRHELAGLLTGAWHRRHTLRLADAVYVELAEKLQLPLVTTDGRLSGLKIAEVVRT